ncbi:MAG: hypothetical protein CMN87_20960 [Stappia sp.]|uniref:DUF5367 family protein n=1 Tax=Stappia sp. TaxID=1870903 RepID=UPI000C40F85E|nr:DUF5367 family protein [Stappia sp.]MAB00945.1 hypothetical protein [Stappia sp.]MBM22475.1 hypothetical protein [Stappia sp.]|tara:strand:+ start:626 stop:1009 length:384 start_codon:yes stop_codon:yes gene_type:complete
MRRGLIVGLVGWLVATLLFRLFGPWFVPAEGGAYLVALLAGGFLAGVVVLFAARFVCEAGKSARFALGILVPGLLGDAATTLAFPTVFPSIPPERAALFAAMMLWGYGLIATVLALWGDRVVRSSNE